MGLPSKTRLVAAVRRCWTAPVRAWTLDVAVVLVLLAIALVAIGREPASRQLTIATPLAVLQALVLLARRARPVEVMALAVALDICGWLLMRELPFEPISPAGLVALYGVGRYRPYATGWIAGGAAVAAVQVSYFFRHESVRSDEISNVVLLFLTVVLGQYIRLRAETAERARTEQAAEAVHAERRRIARELHDVVAHHISVMNVLVGAARTTMASAPVQAEEALAATERTAREAMAEMRQLLAVLRADDEAADPEPGARVSRLSELVDRACAAGVPAELRVEGTARPLPAAVDLAVYRTVQEALTNAHKHAAGARAHVTLHYEPAAVVVEVLDGGLGAAGPPDRSGGYGLRGMAERVALCGGELTAGPRPGHGFRVHARVPVPPERPEPAAEEAAP